VHSEFRRSGAKFAKSDPAGWKTLASLATQWPALACEDAVVRYGTEFDAIPIAGRPLRVAVAQAGGLPNASTTT